MRNGEGQTQSWDDSTPIEKMGLSTRAYNALRGEGLTTLGLIADRTVRELLALPALGARSLGNVINQGEQLDLARRVGLLEEQVSELRAQAGLEQGAMPQEREI